MAQTTAASSAGSAELEEVVVTAEKRETNLQKTAISIQTYSGEQLKREGKKRIDEIMDGVVGVTVQTSQVGSNFYMRGVDGSGGSGPPGGSPQATSVTVIIDGVYQNRGETVRGGSLDVSQVEVMRGSQGTTLGAGALAGAVSLVTNDPVFEYEAIGSLELGNYSLVNTEGVLNVPVSSNQAFRFAYSSNKRKGYTSSGAGDSDLSNARAKYRWKASDTLDLVATVSYNNIGGNGVSDGVLLNNGHWVPYTGQTFTWPDDTIDSNMTLAGVQGDADTLPDTYTAAQLYPTVGSCAATLPTVNTSVPGTLTGTIMGCPPSYIAVRDFTWYFNRDNPWDDGYPYGAWPNSPFRDTNITSYSLDVNWNTALGDVTITPSVQRATFKSSEPPRGGWMEENRVQNTRQLEARIASKPDSKITWLAGLYYYFTDNTGTFKNVVLPGGMYTLPPVVGSTAGTANFVCPVGGYCYTWQDQDEGSQTTYSAFGNFTVPLSDAFRLIGGLRYSKDEKAILSTVDGALRGDNVSFIPNPAVVGTNSGKWNALQYRAGVEYDVRPQSMLYATYQTGYQPGNVGLDMATGLPTAPTDKLTLEQWTLGIKNRFFDNRLQVNIEAFNTAYHNRVVPNGIQIQLTNDGSLTAANVGCGANTGATGTDLWRTAVTGTDGCLALNLPNLTVPDVGSRGVDLEVSFLPTANDRIDASVEWLKSNYQSLPDLRGNALPTLAILSPEVLNGDGSATAVVNANLTTLANVWTESYNAFQDLVLSNSPKWSATLAYQHEFHLQNGYTITPRISGQYKSDYWSSGGGGNPSVALINQVLNTTGFIPGIQRGFQKYDFNMTAQSGDGKFTITGYVRNLTDEATIQNANNTYVSLSPPRTYGVVFSARY